METAILPKSKVPVVFKIPTGLKIDSRSQLKTYCGFALLKTMNPEGRIKIRDICHDKGDRDYFSRLLRNLVALGWTSKAGDVYSLAAYQAVWRKMGIERFLIKRLNRRRFRYVKFYTEQIPHTRTKAIKKIIKLIEQAVCDRKLAQIKYRLSKAKTENDNFKKPVCISSERVGKLLGYKSPTSGHQKRVTYFPMKRQKPELMKVLTPKGILYRFTCGELAI
jgi:hypothetical protein